MQMLKRRIIRYARLHEAAPVTIKDLPRIDGYSNRTADGWGNPIEMMVNGDQIVLRSLGRDERAGGAGDDQDMVGVFSLRTADGQWTDEFVTWIVDPFQR